MFFRCFTFGIGSGASTALVEGLARAGNGTAEFVKEGERLQPKVIRSLKRALQPAVTDVSVEFKVPSEFTPTQSPHNLPPVFSGEKMVVYGILKPKGTPKSKVVSGTAVLKGKLLGKPVKHSVAFTFNPTSETSPLLPTVHHLAAKALIKDWQNDNRSKQDIVKLSIESSVISFHTAFIAVDEENSEPISGAMKTWDVQARYSGAARFRGGRKGGMMLRCSALTGGAMVNRKKGKSAVMAAPKAQMFFAEESSKSARRKTPVKKANVDKFATPTKMQVEDTLLDYDEDSESDESATLGGFIKSATPSTGVSGPTSLSSFVDAQQANGSWKLDAQLAHHLAKSLKEIKDSCPTECKGDVATLWATVLVLSLLRKKYASQQDEWELVGMKAKSWVKKQAIPSGVTLQDFYTAAEKIV